MEPDDDDIPSIDYFINNFDILLSQNQFFTESFNKFAQSDQFPDKLRYVIKKNDANNGNFEFIRQGNVYRNDNKTAMLNWVKQNRLPPFLQSITFLNFLLGEILFRESETFLKRDREALEKFAGLANKNLSNFEAFIRSTENTQGEALLYAWRKITGIYLRPKVLDYENTEMLGNEEGDGVLDFLPKKEERNEINNNNNDRMSTRSRESSRSRPKSNTSGANKPPSSKGSNRSNKSILSKKQNIKLTSAFEEEAKLKFPHFAGIQNILKKLTGYEQDQLTRQNSVKLSIELYQARKMIEAELISYWLPRFIIAQKIGANAENFFQNASYKNNSKPGQKTVRIAPQNGGNGAIPKMNSRQSSKDHIDQHSLVTIKRLEKQAHQNGYSSFMPRLSKSFEVERKQIIRPHSSKISRQEMLDFNNSEKITDYSHLEDEITQTFCLLYTDLEFGAAFGQFCLSPEGQKKNAARNVGGREKISWKTAFLCWSDIQRYRHLFKLETLNLSMIKKFSRKIYFNYIVPFMDYELIQQVGNQMDPAFDDLFDDTEEVIILILVDAAREYLNNNRKTFSKLKLVEYKRKLKLSISALKLRQKNGDQIEREVNEVLSNFTESQYSGLFWDKKFLWRNCKGKFKQFGFSDILLNEFDKEEMILDRENDGKFLYDENPDIRKEYFKPHFLEFIDKMRDFAEDYKEKATEIAAETATEITTDNEKFCQTALTFLQDYPDDPTLLENLSKDLTVWCHLEKIKLCKDPALRTEMCQKLKDNYFNSTYLMDNKFSPLLKTDLAKIFKSTGGYKFFQKTVPRIDVLTDVQRLIKQRIEACLLPSYFSSNEFHDRIKYLKKLEKEKRKMEKIAQAKANRQKALGFSNNHQLNQNGDIFQEIENYQDFESDHTYKIRENEFRKDMKNKAQQVKFYNYLSTWKTNTARFLPNDLLFYLEVLKYQDLFHSQKCKEVIDSKIKSMINTFIKCIVAVHSNNPNNSSCQIDIQENVVNKILKNCRDPNPYLLFQEAKNFLFRLLLRPYNQFKKDQDENRSDCQTDILSQKGKMARKKFRQDQYLRNKKDGTNQSQIDGKSMISGISESLTMTKSNSINNRTAASSSYGSDETESSSGRAKTKPVMAMMSFRLSDYLVNKTVVCEVLK